MSSIELDSLRDIELAKEADTPLQGQLYARIKERILNGRLSPGTKLPSSRSLSSSLSVSRNTVNNAFEQLKSEGYIETKQGSGHFVSHDLPEHFLQASGLNKSKRSKLANNQLSLSTLGESLSNGALPRVYDNQSFEAGVPDLDAFPLKTWSRIYHHQSQRTSLLGYNSLKGYPPLCEVLTRYLSASRGVDCSPEQVIITVGAQQAATIAIQVLLNKGDQAYVEEPGYIGMRKAFHAHGVQTTEIAVGDQGIDITQLPEKPKGRLLCLTPTHQYPMGSIIPLANRMKILQWASENNIWLMEDDYDSEYHYDHKPIAAMQGLGLAEQVIYIGSFSKVLYPGLRLGYMVVPKRLAGACVKAKNMMSGQTALVEQATVAEFIESGHFLRHLRQMRMLYRDKLTAILKACETHLSSFAYPKYSGAGMHIVLIFKPEWCKNEITDTQVVKALQGQQIFCSALSAYYHQQAKHQGLVLGFANTKSSQMDPKIATLKTVLLDLSK